jgi:hypothetical protein
MDVIWWVTAAVGAIAINLIASELFAWGPRLSDWLMRRAVRRLAPEMQERMQEEWAGHLQTIPLGLWRVVAAAGFYLATRQINVALRVRERQQNPEEKTLQEKASGNIHVINIPVGMGKSVSLPMYLDDVYKVPHHGAKTAYLSRTKVGVFIFRSHDEPEPPSKPTPPKQ